MFRFTELQTQMVVVPQTLSWENGNIIATDADSELLHTSQVQRTYVSCIVLEAESQRGNKISEKLQREGKRRLIRIYLPRFA